MRRVPGGDRDAIDPGVLRVLGDPYARARILSRGVRRFYDAFWLWARWRATRAWVAAGLTVRLPRGPGDHLRAAGGARDPVAELAFPVAAGDGGPPPRGGPDEGERGTGVGGAVGEDHLLPGPGALGAYGVASTGLAGEGSGGREHEQTVLAGPEPAGGHATGDEVDVDPLLVAVELGPRRRRSPRSSTSSR